MKNIIITAFIANTLFILILAGIAINKYLSVSNNTYIQIENKSGSRNGTYFINGEQIILKNGYAETDIVPGGVFKEITRYFGNDVQADLNNDDIGDSAFLLTQNNGGSGTFYYVAAFISEDNKFTGTNAIFIGDRIAPQSTEFRDGMIIVNYADRKVEESYTTAPSVGVSKYYKVINNKLIEAVPEIK